MTFPPRFRIVITQLARAVLGLSTDDVPDTEIDWLPERIAQNVATLAWAPRLLYRLITWYFEWRGCLCFRSGLHPFSRMTEPQRHYYLNTWIHARSPLRRLLIHFAAGIAAMNYYGDPAAAARCGYAPQLAPAVPRSPLPIAPVNTALEQAGEIFLAPPEQAIVRLAADVVVIGSGAGGAVAAAELARAGKNVLMLEEGDYHDASKYRGNFFAATRELYRESGATATIGFPPILVPHGRCVGGTTVINSGTMLQLPSSVLQQWQQQYGLTDWTTDTLAPYYAHIQAQLRIQPVTDHTQGPHARLFADGAARLGYHVAPLPRNAPDCQGSGLCCFGCPTNAKLSMALTYLPDALAHGARLVANCRVIRLHHTADRITRIDALWNGTPVEITAEKILLCAGTLRTPLLLHTSRIPDPHHHNGRHLTLHPAVKVLAEMPEPLAAWNGVPQGMYSDDLKQCGVTLESVFLPPAHLAFSIITRGPTHRAVMRRFDHLAAFGALIADSSEGRLFFTGGYPTPYYRINRADLPKYHRALCFLAEVFLAAGADTVHLPLHRLPQISKTTGLAPLAKHRVSRLELDLQAFHPLGTCRMAADARDGVVDATGRVHTMENLYIADGSLFPTSLGVNPQITIMAAAYKIVAGIIATASSPTRVPIATPMPPIRTAQ